MTNITEATKLIWKIIFLSEDDTGWPEGVLQHFLYCLNINSGECPRDLLT